MEIKYQTSSDVIETVAIVTDNDDPEKLGRFKVKVNGTEYPFWIIPQLQWGSFVVPEVGQKVVIYSDYSGIGDTFEGEASIFAPNYRWKGETIFTSESYSKKHIPNAEFKKNYTKRTGFFSKAGHVLVFDDNKGSEDVYIINGKTGSRIDMLADGSIKVEDKDGDSVELGAGKITVKANSEVTVDATSVKLGTGATLGAARINDSVTGNAATAGGIDDIVVWAGKVTLAINGLVPGAILPLNPILGKITSASTKVKCE